MGLEGLPRSAGRVQDKPPKPSSPDVSIEHAKKETFAVLQFGGFLVDDFTLSSKAKTLQTTLDDAGIEYQSDSYFAASYDPPTRQAPPLSALSSSCLLACHVLVTQYAQ